MSLKSKDFGEIVANPGPNFVRREGGTKIGTAVNHPHIDNQIRTNNVVTGDVTAQVERALNKRLPVSGSTISKSLIRPVE